ncbi:MAG: helix-turn-helix transcriptional regulator [Pandoraea sp.]|nr:helix-turn-helix transcriptional regulator [Pandoraea sp.]
MAKSTTPVMPDVPGTPDPATSGGETTAVAKATKDAKRKGTVVPARRGRTAPRSGKTERHVTPASVAHQYLLNAAVELFHTEGVRAVGVDAVVKRAGVNKMCLYRQFASKDELILAYLDHMQTASLARIDESIANRRGEPRAQLLQIFVDLSERAGRPGHRGRLVDALSLILEGAYAASQTFGPGSPPLRILPTVARQIIDAGMSGALAAD